MELDDIVLVLGQAEAPESVSAAVVVSNGGVFVAGIGSSAVVRPGTNCEGRTSQLGLDGGCSTVLGRLGFLLK